jgi:non-structural maintenance of chromosomes element 4
MAGISRMQISNEAFGRGSLGVDVDQFVSRCIRFMRHGGVSGSAPTQEVDPEDDVDEGDTLDWHVLGKSAAFTSNRRPAVPSFLLGPLSVEKRVRNRQRTARQARDPLAAVARPQELRAEDLEKNEGSNLVNLCYGIRDRLDKILTEGGEAVEEFWERPDIDERSDEEVKDFFKQNHLAFNHEVSLFEFAINPLSFGQTVENLFYISFLVRDGFVKVSFDEDGLPTIRK